MKAIIIDDEPVAINTLATKLEKHKDIEIVGTANNGSSGLALLQTSQPDLLFLDVELPDMSGLDFLEQKDEMASCTCRVVMYTAHRDYMLPAFRNNAFDFLLKPLDCDELNKVIQRCQESIIQKAKSNSIQIQSPPLQKSSDGKILFYLNSVDFRLVHIRDIGLFRYNRQQRIWEVVIAGRQAAIRLKRSINNDTLLALDSRFVQVSQSYIININYLLEVNDNLCKLYPPFDNIDYVKVGRLYRKKLVNKFCAL